MRLFAVEGVAGSGKTFRLMEVLGEVLAFSPLADGQRVLALTFMHGARRRLDEKLVRVPGLRRRFECTTIDSFAWRLVRRWRSLAAAIGISSFNEGQYDQQCDAAGALLERSEVRGWIAASFPIVLLDEGQDLKPQRLRLICALAKSLVTLIAADEFQCLDDALRPNPLISWLHQACECEVLNKVRRTEVSGLLAAASAIRDGAPPVSAQAFQIIPGLGIPMAAACLANAIAWRRGGTIAIITPSLTGGFARKVVERVCKNACGKQGNGPFPIRWDRSDADEVKAVVDGLAIPNETNIAEILAALEHLPNSGVVRETSAWVRHQARVTGKTIFSRSEIEAVVTQKVLARRQRYGIDNYDFTAMTVQQAKNREFDGVVVLWPYTVGGDAEQRRRLLYNAITRARRWCTIILQSDDLLKQAPFI